MRYRILSEEITEDEIITLFWIMVPEGRMKNYEFIDEYIRIYYTLPYTDIDVVHKVDFLPDEVYFVDEENESNVIPCEDGEKMHLYLQFMVARGFSPLWKGNPFAV